MDAGAHDGRAAGVDDPPRALVSRPARGSHWRADRDLEQSGLEPFLERFHARRLARRSVVAEARFQEQVALLGRGLDREGPFEPAERGRRAGPRTHLDAVIAGWDVLEDGHAVRGRAPRDRPAERLRIRLPQRDPRVVRLEPRAVGGEDLERRAERERALELDRAEIEAAGFDGVDRPD